jgi:predicted enzyme related to lactoylglutathione lyase
MSVVTEYPAGTPSWVDLGSPDPAAAATFYGGLFGWQVEEGPPEAGGYRMCLLRGQAVAGLGPQQNPEAPPYWQTYVTVDDADKTTALAGEAGAQILAEPFDVLSFGRMAVFFDPTGAALAVWEPRDHIGAGLVNEPGALCWNELTTRDGDAAVDFYTRVFGWTADVQDMGDFEYTLFQVGGRNIAGLMRMEGDVWPEDMPSHWMTYFGVGDCDAAAATAAEIGGTVSVPPTDIAIGRFAVITDPHGAVFSVIKLSEFDAGP